MNRCMATVDNEGCQISTWICRQRVPRRRIPTSRDKGIDRARATAERTCRIETTECSTRAILRHPLDSDWVFQIVVELQNLRCPLSSMEFPTVKNWSRP